MIPFHRKWLEYVNPQRQKANCWHCGMRGLTTAYLPNGHGVYFGLMKCLGTRQVGSVQLWECTDTTGHWIAHSKMVHFTGCEVHRKQTWISRHSPHSLPSEFGRCMCIGPSRGCLTHRPVSLALAPLADVGHGLRDTLEHTKSVPLAVDHFSFVGATVRPRMHAEVHGDALHKVPLGKNGTKSDRRKAVETSPSLWDVLRRVLDYWHNTCLSSCGDTWISPQLPPSSFSTHPILPHLGPPRGRSPGTKMHLEGCMQTELQAASRWHPGLGNSGCVEPIPKVAVRGSWNLCPLLESSSVLAVDLKIHIGRWVNETHRMKRKAMVWSLQNEGTKESVQ